MGEAEKKLWFRLRRRKIAGHLFRRQVPVGDYIVDFACLSARLIIEVDGGRHRDRDSWILDAKRTASLEANGYLVMRFWNSRVLWEIDTVTETIFHALASRTTPHPTSRFAAGHLPPEGK